MRNHHVRYLVGRFSEQITGLGNLSQKVTVSLKLRRREPAEVQISRPLEGAERMCSKILTLAKSIASFATDSHNRGRHYEAQKANN